MRHPLLPVLGIAALALGGFAPNSSAQFSPGMAMTGDSGGNAITGTGTVQLQRAPAALRMYVELSANGQDLEAAFAVLDGRVSAVKKKLEELKADPKAFVVSAPAQSESASDQQERMAQMIRQRLGNRPVPEALKATELVTAVVTLKAEWPLGADDSMPVVIQASRIRRSVESAELAKLGAEKAEEASPEAAEVVEEFELMTSDSDDSVKPGQPVFLYVARVSDEDRRKAMAEAFQKAKTQAAELAQAAGVGMGTLVGLSGGVQGSGVESYSNFFVGDYEQGQYIEQLLRRAGATTSKDPGELVAATPDALQMDVMVIAQFAIAPPPAK